MPGAKSFIEAGFIYLQQNHISEARAHFEEALKILPSSGEAAAGLGIIFVIDGKLTEAFNLIERAFKIEPENKIISESAFYALKLANIPFKPDTVYETLCSYLKAQKKDLEDFDDRTSLINYCISKFKFSKYLEIGCHDNQNFDQINCDYKIGIDPVQGGTMRLTSDEFFALTKDEFDVVFIDGLHHCEQSLKDIRNSLKVLTSGGLIFVHDCMPREEIHQLREPKDYIWNGDVWKAFVEIRQDHALDSIVAAFDHGVGIIRKGISNNLIRLEKDFQNLSFDDYLNHRDVWLQPKNTEQLIEWLDKI